MKKLLILGACLLLITGCGGVKLNDGKNAIVTFKEGGISAQELYDQLKDVYGTEKIVSMIDTYLLDEKYDVTSDETAYIKQAVATATEEAKNYSVDVETYVKYSNGVKDLDAYRELIRLNYRRSLWIEEYGQEAVTDKQIDEYYETQTVGDMDISHILITAKVASDAKEEEKTKAEELALKEANDIIAKLKKGEDFTNLAKSYSDDDDTASKGGSLGTVNRGDYEDEVINEAISLKEGSYSASPIKSQYGYHIVYKTKQSDKPELNDELKTKIRAVVGKEISSDSSFYMTALIALRKKNEMDIVDDELKSGYDTYIMQNTQKATQSNE